MELDVLFSRLGMLIPIIYTRVAAACTTWRLPVRLKIYLSVLEVFQQRRFTPRYLRTFRVSYAGGTQRLRMELEMRLVPSGLEVGGITFIYESRKVGLIPSEIGFRDVIPDAHCTVY